MTRKYLWILLGAVFLLLSACQKAPELTITSPSSIEFSADGSSGSITFTANRAWAASASDSWVTVSPSSGTASDGPVMVTVRCSANTTYSDRTATVTIRMEELSQTVTIRQPANLGIIVPTQTFVLTSEARTIDVEVQANVQYTVDISVDWIRQPGTKGLSSSLYSFSIAENTTYNDREGKITIKSQNTSVPDQVISVKQGAHPHNTTYMWGYNNWGNIENNDNVAKSADSTLVNTVFLKNDGVSFDGMLTRDLLERMTKVFESVPSNNRHKVRGAGTLNSTAVAEARDVTDSTKLVEMGFTFANTIHGHNTTYMWGVDNWGEIWPADHVIASADSILVKNVFLKNDGKSLNGMLARDLYERMNNIIQSVPADKRAKVRGAGTINGAGVADATDASDSTKLAQLGFAFANTEHPHATTYVWGAGNWNSVWPEKTDNVARSADSLMVKTVYLKNDGNSLGNMHTNDILIYMNTIVESVSPNNRGKVRGAGTLNDVGITNYQDVQDSIKLAEFGFLFGKIAYGDFQR